MTLIGAILTLFGLAGWLRPGPIIALLLAGLSGFLLLPKNILALPSALFAWLIGWRAEPWSIRALGLILSLIVLGFGMAALVHPPVGDAEAFYITYAKIMAATGTLAPMPGLYHAFSTISLPGELHFTALMVLADVHAAKFFVWPVALSGAAMITGIARICHLGRLGQLFTVVFLFTSSTFTLYIFDGKVDLFAAALGLAAFYWALVSGKNETPRDFLPLIGIFAGAATVAKFSYLVTFVPALVLLILWGCQAKKEGGLPVAAREAGVRLILTALWAAVAWGPQLLKNAVLFDAPLAPFLGTSQEADWLRQVWFSAETTLWIILTYPLALVFGKYPMQGGGLSLLVIAFAPLALMLARPASMRESPLMAITFAAVLGTVVWVILKPSIIAPRYILAPLLLFFPLVAKAAENVWVNDTYPYLLRIGIWGTVISALTFTSYILLPIPGATWSYLQGRLHPCALASDYCPPFKELNLKAAPGDRVLLGTYYGYWLRPDLLQCRDLPNEMQALEQEGGGREALRRRGFRFVVIDLSTHAPLIERLSLPAADSVDGIKMLTKSGKLQIWDLFPDGGRHSNIICREYRPGKWKLEVSR
jgi:hypothetical protein